MKARMIVSLMVIFLTVALTISIVTSCSSEGNGRNGEYQSSFTSVPDANSAYDSSTGGVYKGMIIGSSGTIMIWLDNGTGDIYADLKYIDNDIEYSAHLTTSDLDSWSSGEMIVAAYFTGTLTGSGPRNEQSILLRFDVGLEGINPATVVQVNGEYINSFLHKEMSNALVMCFIGKSYYEGSEDLAVLWAFNIINYSTPYGTGMCAVDTYQGCWNIGGISIEGDTFEMTAYIDVVDKIEVTGSFDENTENITGTWTWLDWMGGDVYDEIASGSFSGNRCL